MKDTEFAAPVKYLYFGLFFVFIAIIHGYHVLLLAPTSSWMKEVYLTASVIESFAEASIAAAISVFLLSKGKTFLHKIYLCLLSCLVFIHLADFAVVRLMDVSAWRWIEYVFQETLENFIEMIYATNVKLSLWIFGFSLVAVLIGLSCWVFHLLDNLSRKHPIFLSWKKTGSFCLVFFLLLGTCDISISMMENSSGSSSYAKALPWKRTLLGDKDEILEVSGYLKDPKSNLSQLDFVDSTAFSLERKPDLFLFVVESLRDDFLTPEVTPHLVNFREENHYMKGALSCANGTHNTWFSLFYSMYPFHWTKYQSSSWSQGGATLTLLKKMGYQIHVYASSRLNYYGMEESLFGKNTHLVDQIHRCREEESTPVSESDALAIEKLKRELTSSEQRGGRVFIVFLDSTHFGYSWPASESLFASSEQPVDYFELVCQRQSLDLVKKRYKNALHYVDSLFGSFRSFLEKTDRWKDSVVVFTADHGEEFNEYGCIFHASGLSLPQLQIPMYMKLGNEKDLLVDCSKKTSQMDIFPTLFHYLTGDTLCSSFFQGESLLQKEKRPYVIGTRYNASLAPEEFYIQQEGYRLILEFCAGRDVFHNRFLKVKALLNDKEESIPVSLSFIQSHFAEALSHLFSLH